MIKYRTDWLYCSLTKTLRPFSILLFVCFFSCIANAAFNVSTISFDEGYTPLFGDGNLVRSPNGRSARLLLDRFTGININIYMYMQLVLSVLEFNFVTGLYMIYVKFTGSGFISSKMYKYGFFSANIKLPGDYTAGICVAFYVSYGIGYGFISFHWKY